jgi:NAD(P)-dependent dehydrogenase (short-subunit alcohol dehydrogenase family)
MSSTAVGQSLSGRLALVTGAGGPDTGHQTARVLLEAGARVILTDRSERRLNLVAEKLRGEHGGRLIAEAFDLRDVTNISRFVEGLIERHGGIDILVNNAAISPSIADLHVTSEKDWDDTFNVNLKAPWLLCRAVTPGMIERRRGWIVNVTSVAAWLAGWNEGVYGATKAALHSLTRDLAAELGPHNIRVNSVAPGPLDSTWTQEHWDMYKAEADRTPLRRLATPSEVAAVIKFLVSEDSVTITGQAINVSLGWYFTP